jgi:hypothetical protein
MRRFWDWYVASLGIADWLACCSSAHNARRCFFSFVCADEMSLTCAIIRYQAIMKDVWEAHQEEFGQTIVERIESEVGGKYKRLLIKLVEYSL